MMEVVLTIHLEQVGGAQAVAWWAESVDLPGFVAAGASLEELREVAHEAIRAEWPEAEIVAERLARRRPVQTVGVVRAPSTREATMSTVPEPVLVEPVLVGT